jgi:two-component system sensor histidine kinase BaeS
VTSERRAHGRPLWRHVSRLALIVSLVAVATLPLVAFVGLRTVFATVTAPQARAVAQSVAQVLGEAYLGDGRFDDAQLARARDELRERRARAAFVGQDGTQVLALPLRPAPDGPLAPQLSVVVEEPVVADGRTVGEVEVVFFQRLLPAQLLGATMVTWVGLASIVAVLASVAAGRLVAPSLVRPVEDVTARAEAFAAGGREATPAVRSDVSEVRRLDAAVTAMAASVVAQEAASRTLVDEVAHELRTPLAVLQGGLEEMRDGLAPIDLAHVAALHTETLRLGRLVDDLGRLAEVDVLPLDEVAPVDLAALTRDAVSLRGAAFHERGIGVHVDLSPAVVPGDAARLTQVVTNLLDNCLRYCRPGDEVTVRTECLDDRGRLVVADTGPGIPAADLPFVTSRLYRGGNTAGVEGSGIGLAVVKAVVDSHGGTLCIGSPDGEGTTVVVAVPLGD